MDEVVTQQAVKELGHKFRETVLAVGGGKSPEQVVILVELQSISSIYN